MMIDNVKDGISVSLSTFSWLLNVAPPLHLNFSANLLSMMRILFIGVVVATIAGLRLCSSNKETGTRVDTLQSI